MKNKILYIEDDADDVCIVERLFKAQDLIVHSASSGTAAIRLIEDSPPDLVMMHLNMGPENPFEVLQKIKKIKPDIPIIIHSNSISAIDIRQSYKHGADHYIIKPVDMSKYDKIINKVKDVIKNAYKTEKVFYEEAEIALTIRDNKIGVVELYKDGRYRLVDQNKNNYNILYSNYDTHFHLKEAIEEFEYLINNPQTKEIDLHSFFLQNIDFILNEDYKNARSKLTLETVGSHYLVPDFILEPYDNNALCDLLEIKLPSSKIFTLKKNRPRYSSAVIEACAQLREYASYFDDINNRKKISNAFGLNLYKPKLFVIIGRRKAINPFEQRRVQSDLPGLQLRTYDDVLDKMKRTNK